MVTYTAQARQMTEFAPGGRVPFFYPDLWNYWMHGAGGLHIQSRPSWLFAAFLWPMLACFPRQFPLLHRFRHATKIPSPDCSLRSLTFCSCAHVSLSPLSAEPLHPASCTHRVRGRRRRRHRGTVGFFSALGRIAIVQSQLRFLSPFFSCGSSAFRFSSHVSRASVTSKGMRRLSIGSLRNSRHPSGSRRLRMKPTISPRSAAEP